MRDTEQAASLTPQIAGLSSLGLSDAKDVILLLSLINRLYSNRVCCFQILDAVFPKDHFKIICLFKTNKHELIDPKGPENIICTMMKCRETFRAAIQHLTPPAMTIIKF